MSNYRIGMQVHGRVTGIQPYGAFVTLDAEHQGLIHISECHEGYVKSVADYLKVGQTVDVVILDIDEYTGKISLSLRCVENRPRHTTNDLEIYKTFRHKHFWTNRHVHAGFEPIANHLDGWINDSLHRLDAKEPTQ
ncbi:S1 RNA-binding domain-containing protein [Lactiplantibacillus garii]|uniref:S1 RNA-binding domain-containing protein n=1 Tax=Lactiplantibacillus garii TaxID=2306423 RepID=A0A3R8LIK6_9LACO|nr:CvfD/Ygs/GSP13 family RNA-binding post-transcriptional regulator [Lactiplantibacillus garii]RRK09532.1 S1 RNA-binding domain-containing protein [Lactiplantibacillus garii]